MSPKRLLAIAVMICLIATGCGAVNTSDSVDAQQTDGAVAQVSDTLILKGPGIWLEYDETKVTGDQPFRDIKSKLGSSLADGKRGTSGFQDQFLIQQTNSTEVAAWFNQRVQKPNMIVSGSGWDAPTELAFAACGNLQVAGGEAKVCVGKPVRTISTSWYLGGMGPGWSRTNIEKGAICHDQLGACIQSYLDDIAGHLTVKALPCGDAKDVPFDELLLGCVSPQSTVEAEDAISSNCVSTAECAFISFNNGMHQTLDVDADGGLEEIAKGQSPFPTARVCSTQQTLAHGTVVATDSLSRGSAGWVLIRSGGKGGDSRIEGNLQIIWSPSGSCAGDKRTSQYSLNWDPREQRADGPRPPEQSCSGATATAEQAGKIATARCVIANSFIEQQGASPSAPTWLDASNDLVMAPVQAFLSATLDAMSNFDLGPGVQLANLGLTLWALLSSGDKILYTNMGLYTLREVEPKKCEVSDIKPGADFSDCPADSFQQKNLSGLNASEVNFSSLSLRGSNLSGTNLSGAKLAGALMTGANLTGANLTNADVTNADLRNAIFVKTILGGTKMDGALVTGATSGGGLAGVPASMPKFSDIRNGYLVGPSINLNDAKLSGADLAGLNLSRALLNGADLIEANLTGADLSSALLNRSDLSKSNLSNANFESASLKTANLTGAITTGTNFKGAMFAGATWTNGKKCGTDSPTGGVCA